MVVMLLAAGAAHAQPSDRAVAFETECLELDAGQAVPCDEDDATWDLAVAYNALTGAHSVVGQPADREAAVIEGAAFGAVAMADAAGATFSFDATDRPMDGTWVLLVRTDLGATFKVDVSVEDGAHATVTYELLGGGAQ